MNARARATGLRSYEDFQPLSDWVREAGSDTLIIHLPGFSREQLRVQLEDSGILKISGERPLDGNKSSRFLKEVPIPDNCNFSEVRAKFDNGTLYVLLPKTIIWENTNEQTPQTKKSPMSQKTGDTPNSVSYGDDAGAKATSTVGSKNETTDSTNVTNKMKEEDAKEDNYMEKGVDGTTETTANGGLVKESYMHGGGLVLGLDQSWQLMVNVIAAFLVVVSLGIFVTYSFRSPKNAEK